jgi:hypothetical protein
MAELFAITDAMESAVCMEVKLAADALIGWAEFPWKPS